MNANINKDSKETKIEKISGGVEENFVDQAQECFKKTFTCSRCGRQYEKSISNGSSFSFDDVTCCPSCRGNKV